MVWHSLSLSRSSRNENIWRFPKMILSMGSGSYLCDRIFRVLRRCSNPLITAKPSIQQSLEVTRDNLSNFSWVSFAIVHGFEVRKFYRNLDFISQIHPEFLTMEIEDKKVTP